MKIIENILAQLTDTGLLLESVYQTIADTDPNHSAELAAYDDGVQALTREVSGAEEYLSAMRQELASDVHYALWLGFRWNLDCYRNPVNKLLLNADFEELCQESRMHTLPDARVALQKTRAFIHTIPEDKRELLDPISDHFAYLKTWGYKIAFFGGFCLANKLLPHLVPAYTPDMMLSMRLEQKLWDSLGVPAAA